MDIMKPKKEDMLITAINKAKKRIKREVKNSGEEEKSEEAYQERLLEVLKEELGVESSKMSEGDPVEFKVLGKIKTQDDKKYGVTIQSVSIPKSENSVKTKYVVPSPSA